MQAEQEQVLQAKIAFVLDPPSHLVDTQGQQHSLTGYTLESRLFQSNSKVRSASDTGKAALGIAC